MQPLLPLLMGAGRPSLMSPCSSGSSVIDDSCAYFSLSKNLRLGVALQTFVLKLFY